MGTEVGRRRKLYAQPLVGGQHSTCLRSTAGTQLKSCSTRGSTAFLPSVLQAGCSSGLLCTSSLGCRGYRPHRMLALGEQKLPPCYCLRRLASYVGSLTWGHLGWAPVCFAHRGLGGRHLPLQPESPEVSSHCLGRVAFRFCLSRHTWLF